MRIAIASDHAAVELRQSVAKRLVELGHVVDDLGCGPGERVDYPRYAAAVCGAVMQGAADRGILLCGTGIGMSIAANKIVGIRAALVHDVTTARLCAEHGADVRQIGQRHVHEAQRKRRGRAVDRRLHAGHLVLAHQRAVRPPLQPPEADPARHIQQQHGVV